MTIALLLSLFLGIFTDSNSATTQAEASATTNAKIIRPIITDDTGG
jgi:hypothetical protein